MYKTSLDKTALLTTIAVTLLFTAVIGGQLALIKGTGPATPVLTTIACLLIYFIAFAFRPVKYSVTSKELIIHRPLKNVYINRAAIKSAERIERKEIRGAIRTFGVGGLFGYFGRFFNIAVGHTTWYATNLNKAVLVKIDDEKKIILTPDHPDDLLAALAA